MYIYIYNVYIHLIQTLYTLIPGCDGFGPVARERPHNRMPIYTYIHV